MRFQNGQYWGRLTGRYLKHCICVLLVFLAFGLHTAYANWSVMGRDGKRVTIRPFVWENPITGDKIPLLPSKVASVYYGFSTRVPGLRWTVKRLKYRGSDKLDSENYFDFFIVRTPDFNDAQARESEDYILEPEGGEKTVCGRLMLQGTAVDKDGKSYGFSKLQSVFGKDRKRYSVLFISESAGLQDPWDEDALCPVVKSFHDKNDNRQWTLQSDNEWWTNTFSDDVDYVASNLKIDVEEIISHYLGSYQKYFIKLDDLRAEFIKVRGKPYGIDVFDMTDIQKLHLADGSVLKWEQKDGKTIERPAPILKITAYKSYEGQFSQTTREGKKRTGVVFGGLAPDGFILVKAWRSDEKAMDIYDQRWAEAMFHDSLEGVPVKY